MWLRRSRLCCWQRRGGSAVYMVTVIETGQTVILADMAAVVDMGDRYKAQGLHCKVRKINNQEV